MRTPLDAFARTPEFRRQAPDCVWTDNHFRCSTCNGWRGPGFVIRRTNLRPDFPLEVESVDTLECIRCHNAAHAAFHLAAEERLRTEGLLLKEKFNDEAQHYFEQYTDAEREELAASADEETDRIGLTD